MKKMLALGVATVVLALAGAAFAYPTLAGPSGLVNLPNAEVVKAGLLDVAVDYYNSKKATREFTDADGNVVTFESKNSWPIRATYGFGNTFEVGGAYLANAINGKGFWDINAKWRIPYNLAGWDFGLGALYGESGNATGTFFDGETFVDETAKLKATQVYLAGTGCLPLGEGAPQIFATLGVNWTQQKLFETNSGFRFYLGADAIIAKNISILADYQTKLNRLDQEAMWGVAARYAFTPALSAQIGVSNGPISGAAKSSFFAGIDYAFNLGGTE